MTPLHQHGSIQQITIMLLKKYGWLAGLVGLSVATLLVSPVDDWLTLPLYMGVLWLGAALLYTHIIKIHDPTFPRALFWGALAVKMLGGLGHYWVSFTMYGGTVDAAKYHRQALTLVDSYYRLDFALDLPFNNYTNIGYVTSLLYTIFPANLTGAFLFFAGLGFAGSVCLYGAFCVAFPDTSPTLYRVLVFFMPTIVFWPASLGKEAWILFCSGLVAYGVVLYFRRATISGLVLAGIAVGGAYLIRPHMALPMVGAFVMAQGVALVNTRFTRRTWITLTLLGVLVLASVFGGVYFLQTTYRGFNTISLEQIRALYEIHALDHPESGAYFKPVSIFEPLGLALAPITVLLRPFLWEAHNILAVLTSLESLACLVIVWLQRHTLWQRLRRLHRDPWLVYVVVYAAALILLTAGRSNFAIIARQRSLILPYLWMLLG